MRRSALFALAAFVTLLFLFLGFREYEKRSKAPPRAVPVMLTSNDAEAKPTSPLSFYENAGQLEATVAFHVESAGHTVLFEQDRIALRRTASLEGADLTRSEISVRFEGAAKTVPVTSGDRLPGIANFYRGNDPARWQTGVETYDGVRYEGLYNGIDLVYNGATGTLKREFIVAPYADPRAIRMSYEGLDALYIRDDGVLVVETPFGRLTESAPFIYQTIDGVQKPVSGAFELVGDHAIGFKIGAYDPSLPLVIDPEITFASYYGGSGFDNISSIDTYDGGDLFVGGTTNSANFPLVNAHQAVLGGGFLDMFVSRVDPTTGTVVYSTFLGGSETESLVELKVDGDDNVFVFGRTSALDFPTLNAVQVASGGSSDAVAAKFGPDGTLLFSTYLGGTDDDRAGGMDLDSDGNIWMAGRTSSADFPTTPDAVNGTALGGTDIYVTQLSSDGSTILYSSYLGGTSDESAEGLSVDGVGDVFLSGSTQSTEFTGVASLGSSAAYVAKLHNDGINPPSVAGVCTADGTSSDFASNVAVDTEYVYFAGSGGAGLPTSAEATQPAYGGGGGDGILGACFKETMELAYLSYLGTSDFEFISALDVEPQPAAKSGSSDYEARIFFIQLISSLQTLSRAYGAHLRRENPEDPRLFEVGLFELSLEIIDAELRTITSYDHSVAVGGTYGGSTLSTTANATQPASGGSYDGSIITYMLPMPGRISGYVYHDSDENGARDAEDFGISGLRLQLFQSTNVIEEVLTELYGDYLFDNVEPGDYEVRIKETPGLSLTFPFVGFHALTTEPGIENGNNDFGVYAALDWGDLPDPRDDLTNPCPIGGPLSCYRTVAGVLGAAHVVHDGSIILGTRIDADPNGQPTALADGDDLNESNTGGEDDEDGLQSFTILPNNAFEVTVMVHDQFSGGGILDVFVDLNDDGVLNDGSVPGGSREHVISSAVVNGINTVESPPGVIQPGDVLEYLRLRISSQGTPYAWGAALDGEVEDYHRSAIQTATEEDPAIDLPKSYALQQNYPNPFNAGTVIRFELPEQGVVTLKVYDVLGREVKTLAEGPMGPGRHELRFDAKDLTSGVYMYTLRTEGFSQTRRMLLLK